MLVGYMRVSSDSDRQTTALQRDALLAAGVDERHLFEDKASGARDDRPGLAARSILYAQATAWWSGNSIVSADRFRIYCRSSDRDQPAGTETLRSARRWTRLRRMANSSSVFSERSPSSSGRSPRSGYGLALLPLEGVVGAAVGRRRLVRI
jgi:DNA invertase Pin-like site-specific DNA recombinase